MHTEGKYIWSGKWLHQLLTCHWRCSSCDSGLSSRKLSGRRLSGRRLSGRKLSGRRLSGRKLSGWRLCSGGLSNRFSGWLNSCMGKVKICMNLCVYLTTSLWYGTC